MARIARLALHPIMLILATALACHALLPLLAEFQDRAVRIDFIPAPWDTAAALRLYPAHP